MTPQTQAHKPKNSSKVNLTISLVFHGLIIFAIVYFAAREGLLGKQLKKIAVEMVKEKPPEKPKEEKPKEPEPPKVETPKIVEAPRIEAPKMVEAPPPVTAPAVAPPTVDTSFFQGKEVVSTSDPVQLYKGTVENAVRSHWDRPTDMDDASYVAEVEVSVSQSGEISDPVWKKTSGAKRWDDSVSKAIASTRTVNAKPPSKFPARVVVRFDVLQTEAINP